MTIVLFYIDAVPRSSMPVPEPQLEPEPSDAMHPQDPSSHTVQPQAHEQEKRPNDAFEAPHIYNTNNDPTETSHDPTMTDAATTAPPETPLSPTRYDRELTSLRLGTHPKLISHRAHLAQILTLRRYCNEMWKNYQLKLAEKCYQNELQQRDALVRLKKAAIKEKLLAELNHRKRKLLDECGRDASTMPDATSEPMEGEATMTGVATAVSQSVERPSSRKLRSKKPTGAYLSDTNNNTDSATSLAAAPSMTSTVPFNLSFSTYSSVGPFSVAQVGYTSGSMAPPTGANSTAAASLVAGPSHIRERLTELEIDQDLEIFRQSKGIVGPITRRTIKSIKASFQEDP